MKTRQGPQEDKIRGRRGTGRGKEERAGRETLKKIGSGPGSLDSFQQIHRREKTAFNMGGRRKKKRKRN